MKPDSVVLKIVSVKQIKSVKIHSVKKLNVLRIMNAVVVRFVLILVVNDRNVVVMLIVLAVSVN